MTKEMRPVIYVDKEKCTYCQRCIMACPVKMCNNDSGDCLDLDPQLCIGCGSCIKACVHGARKGIDDIDAFFDDLEKGVKIIAIVAPAVIVNFKGKDLELNGFLKSKGVKAVFDVSFGAELTTKSYVEFMKKANPDCMISQPCPAIVTFCEIYRPELLKLLAPSDSPMLHTMKMIRKFYPEYNGYKIAAISPCFAKRREFDETGLGDYNVTMLNLDEYFKNNNIKLSSFPKVDYDNIVAERGVLYSSPGGLMRTAERFVPGISEQTRKIEGSSKIINYLANFTKTNKGKKPPFKLIDCLNCENGCNGGAGTSNQEMHEDEMDSYIESRMASRREYWRKKGKTQKNALRKLNKAIDEYWKPGLYDRTYVDRSGYFKNKIKEPTPQQIKEIYKDMNKNSASDVLDCGSCGYDSCEQMAVSIFNGLNKVTNCVHYVEFQLRQAHAEHKEIVKSSVQKVADISYAKIAENEKEVDKLVGIARNMSESVSQSSAAVEEMIANINSIDSILSQNSATVTNLDKATQNGKDDIDKVANLVSDIEQNSKGLEEMSDVIQEIASQTNLLAMNAAIEAAHAGESGKGFAVVADEIRKLSETSAGEAKKISEVLKKVKTLIDMTFTGTDAARKGFDQVVTLSSTVTEQEFTVKRAISEQNEGSKQVLYSIGTMKELTQKVAKESEKLLANTNTLRENMKNISAEIMSDNEKNK